MCEKAKAIDALLPQTQCGECGFNGCMPYADALANGKAPINLCPPGGIKTLRALGEHLNINTAPYEQTFKMREPTVAVIDEKECIGCTKCIQACPVDAIVGKAKQMHTIISNECTGCNLCIEPCPVDCIETVPVESLNFSKEKSRIRHQQKIQRQLNDTKTKQNHYIDKRLLIEKENKLGSIENHSKSLSPPTFRGLSAESIDPADKPRGVALEVDCQQALQDKQAKQQYILEALARKKNKKNE